MSMSEGLEQRPYRPSVGDQIWDRALRNHLNKGERDRLTAAKDPWETLQNAQYRQLYQLIVHEVVQSAAAYLHEHNMGEVTATSIAALIRTQHLSLDEQTIRRHLRETAPHLSERYGISITPRQDRLEQVDQDYRDAIVSLWKKNGRRPTYVELAKELDQKSSSSVRDKIKNDPSLFALLQKDPSSEDLAT